MKDSELQNHIHNHGLKEAITWPCCMTALTIGSLLRRRASAPLTVALYKKLMAMYDAVVIPYHVAEIKGKIHRIKTMCEKKAARERAVFDAQARLHSAVAELYTSNRCTDYIRRLRSVLGFQVTDYDHFYKLLEKPAFPMHTVRMDIDAKLSIEEVERMFDARHRLLQSMVRIQRMHAGMYASLAPLRAAFAEATAAREGPEDDLVPDIHLPCPRAGCDGMLDAAYRCLRCPMHVCDQCLQEMPTYHQYHGYIQKTLR